MPLFVYREEILWCCPQIRLRTPESKWCWSMSSKIVTSCAYTRINHISFHLLPLSINWIDTLAVNDVNSSCQIFCKIWFLPRPDEPEIKNVFKLCHCFWYPQKLLIHLTELSMNFLFLMTTPVACISRIFVEILLLLTHQNLPCNELLVKCFL